MSTTECSTTTPANRTLCGSRFFCRLPLPQSGRIEKYGMCADVAIHDPYPPGHNPHAHILLTVRPLDEKGKWQYKTEKEYLCVKNGKEQGFTAAEFKQAQADGWEKQYQYKVGKKKVYMVPSSAQAQGYERVSKYPKSTKYGRQNPISERWNSEEQLVFWRKAWADVTNLHLERAGQEGRIDYRGHAERELEEQPTIHEGVIARALEKKGIVSDRCELNRQIKADNALLRELKAQMKKMAQAVKNSLPAIAEAMETLRANTHEPLITKELWELVREVRRHKRKAPKKFEEPNLFSGLLYCADCGAPLRLHRTRTQTAHFYNNFKCSTYSNRGKDACSGHYIRESQLKAIVLDDLRRVTQFARQKENLLLRHVARQNSAQAKKEISLLQGELDKLRRREQELTALFKRLYEDNVLGRIPDEQYRILSAEYTQERTLLQEKIPQMAEQQEKLRDSIANAARFVERARQYSTITELTPELLRLFIDKIVIGERSAKYSRCAAQEVSIYYRDVGLLDTAEELDMENLLSDTAASA